MAFTHPSFTRLTTHSPIKPRPLSSPRLNIHLNSRFHKYSSRNSAAASQNDLAAAAAAAAENTRAPNLNAALITRQATAMFCASAVLGPLCDNLHSQYGVLKYAHPAVSWQLLRWWPSSGAGGADGGGAGAAAAAGDVLWALETTWWTPLLFGVAGVIIGVGLPVLDELARARRRRAPAAAAAGGSAGSGDAVAPPPPSWPAVLLCIALFCLQYALSGWLHRQLLFGSGSGNGVAPPGSLSTWPVEDAVLCASAAALWWAFDRTPQGAFMAALTAVCGPLVEIGLINGLHLYNYAAPQVAGVPTWICWVYVAGGPAVGSLGRRVWATLQQQQQDEKM